MARGGARPGGPGVSRRKRFKQTKVELVLDKPFDGDAHDLLIMVYKDSDLPLAVRLEAAKQAIGSEKPRLGATALMDPNEMKMVDVTPRRPTGDRLRAMASAPLKVIEEKSLSTRHKGAPQAAELPKVVMRKVADLKRQQARAALDRAQRLWQSAWTAW